jgi:hypothetical protein
MASMKNMREGLAANLGAIPGMQVSAYMLSNPTPPAAHVLPAEITYDTAMRRGQDVWFFTVQVFVSLTTDIGAQKLLDKMLASSGSDSVKAAVESDRTLGGACDDLRVVSMGGYEIFVLGERQLLGATWRVEVIATG